MAYTDATVCFRKTAAFVTDPSLATHAIEGNAAAGDAEQYPVTRALSGSADDATFGNNEASVSDILSRDRNSGNDARLAGFWFNGGLNPADIRLDLPASGQWVVHVGLGESTYARANMQLKIFDNATELITIAGSTTSANSFLDATAAQYTQATFFANEVGVSLTFATTIMKLRIGDGTNACYLAFVRVVQGATAAVGARIPIAGAISARSDLA